MSKTDLLLQLHDEWESWAIGADRSEPGWETDFPRWSELSRAVVKAMRSHPLPTKHVATLSHCWAISEETEELSEYAAEHIDECWPAVEAIARSDDATARWQAYSAAASAGTRGERLLRDGLVDPEPYARRRAILALAHVKPRDAARLAEPLLRDSDAYIRQAAIELVAAAADDEFARTVYEDMRRDESEHVRCAAERRLGHFAAD